MKTTYLLLAAAALGCLATAANATVITQTFNIKASDFGAGAPVDPVTGLPLASFDNLVSTALGFTLIDELTTAGDVSGMLSLDLAAGTYGVVFGSGQFGATGVGAFTESTPFGDPMMFESFFGSAFSNRSDDVRLFVMGEVPEPASIALMLAGLAGLGWLVTRRRKDAFA